MNEILKLMQIARMTGNAAEIRRLGAEFMKVAWTTEDPTLAVGWMVNDWLRLVSESPCYLDKLVDGIVVSQHEQAH